MQSISVSQNKDDELEAPLPPRWQASLANLATAKTDVTRLQRALADAIFLDEEEWKRNIPVNQLNLTIQVRWEIVRRIVFETQLPSP